MRAKGNLKKVIWIIDDNKSEANALEEAITRIDSNCEFRIIYDFGKKHELENAIQPPEEFDDVEVCLVDLELLKAEKQNDLRNVSGASFVLPRLRAIAPWVPVVAVSGYIDNVNLKSQPTIGCHPFDGMLTKDAFIGNNSFYNDLWQKLLQRFRDNLYERITLSQPPDAANLPKLDFAGDGESEFNSILGKSPDPKTIARGKELLSQFFPFSRRIYIETLQSGNSGARVFRVMSEPKLEYGNGKAYWVLKASAQPSKLARELRAHAQILRAGLPHTFTVPLLWRSVLAIPKLGLIAYQHAENKGTALDVIIKTNDTKVVFEALRATFSYFSQRISVDQVECSKILYQWFDTWSWKEGWINGKPCHNVSEFLAVAGEMKNAQNNSLIWQVSSTLIHGDLHSGNILIGEPNTLIDFSRSRFGPLVVDLAKIVADLWIEAPKECPEKPNWQNTEMHQEWRTIFAGFKATEDDKALFDILIQVYLSCAPDYYKSLRNNPSRVARLRDTLKSWNK